MRTATLINATVKYPVDRVRKTKYGDKIKLVCQRDNGGDDIELWDVPGAAINYLAKGTPLQILFDGQRYTLLSVPDTDQPTNGNGHHPEPAPTRPPATTPEVRANLNGLSADIKEWLTIFAELEQARPDLQEATRRAATNTLFMIRCRIRSDFEQEPF